MSFHAALKVIINNIPVSLGEYATNVRIRKKWQYSGKEDVRSGFQVVYPIFFQTESFRSATSGCLSLIGHVNLFLFQGDVFSYQ